MFTDELEAFLSHCKYERNFSSNTVDAYRSDLTQYWKFSQHDKHHDPISVGSLRAFLKEMVKNQDLSEATVRRRMASLRTFCRYASETSGTRDPFSSWTPSLKRPKKLPRAVAIGALKRLTETETTTNSVDAETTFCILLLCATGLRVSELCAILLADISADGASIHVAGKGSKDRVVYVGNSSLRRQLVLRRLNRMDDLGAAWAEGPLLLNSLGRQLKPQTLRRRMHKLVSSKDLQLRITPHALRHTAATLLIEGGMDIRLVQRQLGHASIATTELYAHVSDSALKQAVFQSNPIARLTG